MSLELALIVGFIFHFLGDYIFQNDWMAENKTKSFYIALIHAFIYSFPFLFITSFPFGTVVFITHFLIDRYRLATYWIRLVNVRRLKSFKLNIESELFEKGDILNLGIERVKVIGISKSIYRGSGSDLIYLVTRQIEGVPFWKFNFPGTDNCGYWDDKPKWMAVWLMIIIDNVFHVVINSICIFLSYYCYGLL